MKETMAPMQRWPSITLFFFFQLDRCAGWKIFPQSLSCIVVYNKKSWKRFCSCCTCHKLILILPVAWSLDSCKINYIQWSHTRFYFYSVQFHLSSIGFNVATCIGLRRNELAVLCVFPTVTPLPTESMHFATVLALLWGPGTCSIGGFWHFSEVIDSLSSASRDSVLCHRWGISSLLTITFLPHASAW